MNENDEKLIQERKNKIHDAFANASTLYQYLFETLNNFYYRYLEKELVTSELRPNVYGAFSESNMIDALKSPHPEIKSHIIALAKENRNATVRYGLWVEIKELTQDYGKMKIITEINWGHPEFQNNEKRLQKIVDFEYDDLGRFRKELALKLEAASELFI